MSRDIWTIGDGVHAIPPTGVDEVHEQVPCPGAVERLVAQAVFAMEDRHLEWLVRLLRTVVVPRSAGLAYEQGRAVRGDVPAGVSGERNDDGVQRSGARVRGRIFVPITRGEPAVIAQRGVMRALRALQSAASGPPLVRAAVEALAGRRWAQRGPRRLDYGDGADSRSATSWPRLRPHAAAGGVALLTHGAQRRRTAGRVTDRRSLRRRAGARRAAGLRCTLGRAQASG
jgi:hypothetical protein